MNQILFLFFILILSICLNFFFKLNNDMEGYTNYSLAGVMGNFPYAQTSVLLEDTYPSMEKKQLSTDTSSDIWWHYPTFKLGSYDQITNNIRYPNNPDIGTCTPASMCGALYNAKKTGTNYVEQLPPVNPSSGTRIGYFKTDENLLPFRIDTPNILY